MYWRFLALRFRYEFGLISIYVFVTPAAGVFTPDSRVSVAHFGFGTSILGFSEEVIGESREVVQKRRNNNNRKSS